MPQIDPNIPLPIYRVTLAERLKLAKNLNGLLVYQIDHQKGFYCIQAGTWFRLLMVEDTAGVGRPQNPYIGQTFVDFSEEPNGILIVWNGSDWVNVTGAKI